MTLRLSSPSFALRAGVLAIALSSCTVRTGTDAGGMDAGRDAPRADVPLADVGHDAGLDVTLLDAADDAGLDAPVTDTPAPGDTGSDAPLDAGTDAGRDAPGTDAGSLPPTIDGVLSAGEWSAAVIAVDLTATVWTGNELRGLRVLVSGDSLYVALEGRVEGGNAMAVYIDRDLDEAVGVASLATLTDNSGALDAAITADLITPAGFRTDLIFGTLDMSRSASGSDARMGFRDLNRAASLSDLFWVTAAVAPIACSASACEARLPLSELGGTAPRRMGFFARIVNADGSMSPNQTLPSDAPAMPRTVSVVLELSE